MQNTKLPPTPLDLFEGWISIRENESYDPLSRAASVPYAYIWKRWCDWLQEQPSNSGTHAYWEAGPRDVQEFLLNGSSPASGRKARSASTSPVTRQRYGRVLSVLYQFAVEHHHLSTNPVTEEIMGTPPTEEERGGQILPPRVFEALYLVLPVDPTPYEKRDKAIMLLLLECALTPGEVRNIKIGDVCKNTKNPGQYLLHLDGPRGAQDRSISTTGAAGYALHQWLVHRKVMHRNTNVIFVSEKRGPMTRRALFGLVAKMITLACQVVRAEVPNHIGPMVIRNNCIVRWYNAGKPVVDICRDAGFKDGKSFMRGLRVHLKEPAVREATSAGLEGCHNADLPTGAAELESAAAP